MSVQDLGASSKAACTFQAASIGKLRLTKPNILNHLTVLLAPAGIYVYQFKSAILQIFS